MRKAFLALTIIFAIAISTAVYAENETTAPPADPCANVQCNSPPAAACDGNAVKTYSSSGTCSNGQCSYSSSTASCRFGCSLGTCKPCEPSACGTNSKTCPDGFTSTCQQSCAGDSCATCEPSCAGHETAPATGTSGTGTSSNASGTGTGSNPCANVVCNTPPATSCSGNNIRFFSSPGACNNGACSYPETGYACQYGCSNGACNPPPANGTTPSGCPQTNSVLAADASGRCTTFKTPCDVPAGWSIVDRCPSASTSVQCGNNICEPGEADVPGGCGPDADPGCIGPPAQAGTCPSDCSKRLPSCPPGCECKTDEHGGLTTFCPSQQRCNNNNVCDKDEDSSCRDCIGAECPVNKQCSDGSTINCFKKETGCQCEPCPLSGSEIPPGCRQDVDKETGFIRVVCEQRGECPPAPQDVRIKCADEGGTPKFNKDHRGCNVFQCDFGGERSNSPVFAGPSKCPSPEAVIQSLEKCRDFGLPGVIGFEGGCKIGKCVQEQRQERPRCPQPNRRQVEQECLGRGMDVAPYFQDGCPGYRCVERRESRGREGGHRCEQDLPKEAYDRCAEEGGQLVVRKNQNGCVSYSNCIRRGNAEESFVEDINEIPDTTELLSIAFKLEDLKLEFDKLAKKTNDIAEYYKSTGSTEEKRFRRVSDMFSNAKDKVDEVKNKLRDSARDIDKDDVLEIKQDLRYLKDVVLKDILFVMLGSGEEIEEIKSGSTKDCGTDESCFDRAFRVCQPLTFRPEGREGPVVEVTGLEGDACVMEVRMEAGQGPPGGPYQMTCKIEKYSLGVSNPETDIFPYCSGNLLDMIKKYGTQAPGVPGKCSGDECRDYCGRGPTEAKECLQYMGDVLPPEAKRNLEALAEGRSPGRFSGRGGFGGGEEFNEGGEFREGGRGDFREGPQDFRGGPQDFRGGPQDFREGEFQSGGEFRGDFGGEFEGEFHEDFGGSGGFDSGGGGCSGCLNNGQCDPGECQDCADCRRS